MKDTMEVLFEVLNRTRQAIANPANDFSWSGWNDVTEALAEFDDVVESIRAGSQSARDRMDVLFSPTGPIQEVSISSGWGGLYLDLAKQFDAAMRKAR